MNRVVSWWKVALSVFSLVGGPVACDQKAARADEGDLATQRAAPLTLTLGAYTTPREAYGKAILPAFEKKWRAESGKDVKFNESYLGSGAQSRAILAGFEADVAALSLEPDIDKLQQGGLLDGTWKNGKHHGVVTQSVVVIGVRDGNPLGIRSWEDLARPSIAVLTPNVRTSGGAMWNILAIYGAVLRGHAGTDSKDVVAATRLLSDILRNVTIMDRGARESMLTFEKGMGDAIITYENEILLGRRQGKHYDYVIPPSTILIENPVAIVTEYAQRHGTQALAQAFVDFLYSPEAQSAFADYGYRPVVESAVRATRERFEPVEDLFTIADLGGWSAVNEAIFAAGAAYDRALEQGKKR